ncbi:MAG: WhiB family transcriptional regulator, redox-sensing transcriptional regulator [Frankiaceae bacterium]|jgi:WhiB family redox-sensing transcriptional regulator|nr:WhiB family transcriptional regulator, redox-sensing transcriptional regulator [Frankiaceae bacterium]
MTDVSRLPAPLTDSYDWQLLGSCRGADPAVFFLPESERGPSKRRRERQAKAICHGCPVVAQCAQFALSTREQFGVWGGLTPRERELLLSHPRAVATQPVA